MECSDEPVDEDWISWFFSFAENVTSEHMQRLWGKILAGEVKSPGSFSLRALELIKTISKDEAETLSRVKKYITATKRVCFIWSIVVDNPKYDIVFDDIFNLTQAGIINETTPRAWGPHKYGNNITIQFGSKKLTIKKEFSNRIELFPCYGFTRAGYELSTLIEPVENQPFFDEFLEELKKNGNLEDNEIEIIDL